MKALQEIEMGNVMGLGAAGADGRIGGRLERELEVWEGVVRGKRKGYRDSIKAKARDGGEVGVEGEEPDVKRVRIDGGGGGDEETEGQEVRGRLDEGRQLVVGGSPVVPLRRDEGLGEEMGESTGEFAVPMPRVNGTGQHGHTHFQTQQQRPQVDDELDEDLEPEDTYQDDDETEDEEQAEEEEDEDEEDDEVRRKKDDEIDGYGPDEQLRRGMNGEVDDGGTDEDSD